ALLAPVNYWTTAAPPEWNLSRIGAAMLACILTYDGWVVLSMVAGEVRKPGRTLPLGLVLGVGLCMAIYITANAAYLKVLPVDETARAERVATRVAEITMGPSSGKIVALIVLLSIVGSMNGWVLAGPRIYFAQARDGLLFAQFASVHPRY